MLVSPNPLCCPWLPLLPAHWLVIVDVFAPWGAACKGLYPKVCGARAGAGEPAGGGVLRRRLALCE